MRVVKVLAGILAAAVIVAALWQLRAAQRGIVVEPMSLGAIPATVYRPAENGPGPAVVIAHGFAGSQQLMQSFALSFARNGYVAVTFDFAGHGRNPRPMSGDIEQIEGATRRLVDDVAAAADEARKLGDGRLAVLGHSMASDIVVRFAQAHPDVAATIAVSMFSPAVTAASPKNLLVIVGDWEGMLKREALRVVGLVSAPQSAEPGVTYGAFDTGTARRAAFSPHVEHASVLFSAATMRESLAWLNQSFGITRAAPPETDGRGPWIMALLAGIVLLAWPLAGLLPRVSQVPLGAGLGWRSIWPAMILPMIGTPLLLRVLPTQFLPVLVADYIALHFLAYGALTFACLLWLRRRNRTIHNAAPIAVSRLLLATALVIGFGFVALVWPLDRFVTSFVPVGDRPLLIAVLFGGTLLYFLSDEWLTRGAGAARFAPAVSKLAFLVSLGFAVALDLERLFFLIIIVPVIGLFFIVYGLFSRWIYGATHHPLVSGAAAAVAFAWAIGVTFPLVTS